MADFVHLHLYSEYSLLDGFVRIADLPAAVKAGGMEAIAITDKANLFAAVEFYNAAKKHGVKAIIAAEISVLAAGSPQNGDFQRALLYAKDEQGYRNLVKIVSLGYENSDENPYVSIDELGDRSGGIICAIGLAGSRISEYISRGSMQKAKEDWDLFLDIFGKSNLYLQVSKCLLYKPKQGIDANNRYSYDKLYEQNLSFIREYGVPPVATNEVCYLREEDSKYRDVLLCIGRGIKLEDFSDRDESGSRHLKTADEMKALFSELPEAIENTALIASACNYDFDFNKHHLPSFPLPVGTDARTYLKELCYKGLYFRFSADVDEKIRKRLDYELSIIGDMGFSDYFLICADFVAYAKSNGILVGPGRGSGGGSLAGYVLGITDVNPIDYGLIFERFLNPERISMPDFDIDFQDDRRAEVIEYVTQKYGADRVAQIVTFGTLSAKAVIRDVGRVLSASQADIDRLAKAVPNKLGISIDAALSESRDFKLQALKSKLNSKIIENSIKLEGLPRHASTHAAGLVICNRPISDIVPTMVQGSQVLTQYNMTLLEKLGLLKIDFLGLRYLSIISRAISSISKNEEAGFTLDKIDYSDKKTYNLISRGRTLGVFQLESAGMIRFLRQLKPRCIEDIIVGISLYRPGPMESIPQFLKGRARPSSIKYQHPLLKPIIESTYGTIVYQEQVMEIVRSLAGFSYGRSDLIRRAMSKKNMEVMQEERKNFIFGNEQEGVKGAVNNGVPQKVCEDIYDHMIDFAKYAFNKSHAAGYAIIAYQSAYLKANYPAHYMAALLSSVVNSHSKIAQYIDDARAIGIKVYPPCVKYSSAEFSVENGGIRYGLHAIKHVGEGLAKEIEALQGDAFPKTIVEFYSLISHGLINKKSAEALALSGALDCFSLSKSTAVLNFEKHFNAYRSGAYKSDSQISLIDLAGLDKSDLAPKLILVDEYDTAYLQAKQHEYLGFSTAFDYPNAKKDKPRSLYVRVPRLNLNEKRYFNGLIKSKEGYTLYVYDELKQKMHVYKDAVFVDNTVKAALAKRFGEKNVKFD